MTIKQSNTELNRLQKKLSYANTKADDLQQLINQAQLGIFITNQNVEFLHVNEQAAIILGYTVEELYKVSLMDLTPQNELVNIAKRGLKNFSGIPAYKSYKTTILNKSGQIIPIQVSALKINWDGQPARAAIFSNISRINLLENEFQKLKNEHSQMMNNQTYLIARTDQHGRIISINKSFSNFFNKAEDELIGESFNQLIYCEDQELTIQTLDNLKRKPHSKSIRQRAIIKGEIKWIEWLYTAVIDENNKIIAVIIAVRDKSDLHALQEKLAQSEKKYRERFNSILDPFSSSSVDGRLLEYNDEFGKMMGFDPKINYVGFDMKTSWPNIDDRNILFNKLVKNGFVENYKIKLENVKNERIELNLNAFLVTDIDGNILRGEATYYDSTIQLKEHNKLIDNQYLLEQKIKYRTKQLTKANKNLNQKNIELKQVESAMKLQNLELEKKNIALHELMTQASNEKKDIGEKVHANITKLLLPLLNKIKQDSDDKNYQRIVAIEDNLENITNSFGLKLLNNVNSLSTRETEICTLIKSGFSSKEIASMLNISNTTVVSHRNRIRRKLNIQNKKINLTTYLNSL